MVFHYFDTRTFIYVDDTQDLRDTIIDKIIEEQPQLSATHYRPTTNRFGNPYTQEEIATNDYLPILNWPYDTKLEKEIDTFIDEARK